MNSQTLLTNFEAIRPGNGDMIPGTLPDASYPIGFPMKVSAYDVDSNARTFAAADNTAFDGFLTRAVTEDVGPTLTAQVFPNTELETPFTHSGQGTITKYDSVIVESTDYLDASLTTSATAETELTFSAGKFKAATSGDLVFFKLAKQLTPNTSGNARILVVAVNSYKKA